MERPALTVEYPGGAEQRGERVKALNDDLDTALRVHIEPVQDRLDVRVGVRRARIGGRALHVLADHDYRQQDELEEGLSDPRDQSLAPLLEGRRAGRAGQATVNT